MPAQASSAKKNTSKLQVIQRECQILLDQVLADNNAVVFVALSTVDGNSFAFASSNEDIVDNRIAAMTSSLLALSESLSKESLRGTCSYNAVSTEFGSIVTVRVPTKRKLHTLSLCTDTSENMAMSMRLSFDTADKLAQVIGHP